MFYNGILYLTNRLDPLHQNKFFRYPLDNFHIFKQKTQQQNFNDLIMILSRKMYGMYVILTKKFQENTNLDKNLYAHFFQKFKIVQF